MHLHIWHDSQSNMLEAVSSSLMCKLLGCMQAFSSITDAHVVIQAGCKMSHILDLVPKAHLCKKLYDNSPNTHIYSGQLLLVLRKSEHTTTPTSLAKCCTYQHPVISLEMRQEHHRPQATDIIAFRQDFILHMPNPNRLEAIHTRRLQSRC